MFPKLPMAIIRSILFCSILGLVVTLSMTTSALALDANGASANKGNSMDEVARMIRQTRRWQILEAVPQKSGKAMRYRFKVINTTGKVKIISIDPLRPNLRKLEQ